MKLYATIKIYDYRTEKEMRNHMKEMLLNNWHIRNMSNQEINNNKIYSIEYYKFNF